MISSHFGIILNQVALLYFKAKVQKKYVFILCGIIETLLRKDGPLSHSSYPGYYPNHHSTFPDAAVIFIFFS